MENVVSITFSDKTDKKMKYFDVWMKQDGVSWPSGILGVLLSKATQRGTNIRL
jgi:hypothetical protein